MESAFAVYNRKNKPKKEKIKSPKHQATKKRKLQVKSSKTSILTNGNPKKSKIESKKPGKATNLSLRNTNGKVVDKQKIETKSNSPKLPPENSRKVNHEDDDEVIPQLVQPLNEQCLAPCETPAYTPKALNLLKWLLHPVKPGNFFDSYWERGPLHIARKLPDYYANILTTADVDTMLRENPLYFGRNVDIVTYKDGERVTVNPAGRAKSTIVFNAYSDGYSVRILNPQTYNAKVHYVLATLQEYFGAMVGANVYLTPPDSQGFAPHYDDIEAFVVQVEGRKHWKLYKPKNECDNLARFSSKNFSRDDLGELISEVTLNAGDILYFPRGIVHEASTDKDMHSLHITISTYQRTAYVDLLEKMLPEALKEAAAEDIEYRKGLPIGYLKQLGIVNSEVPSAERNQLINKIKQLVVKLCDHMDVDNAADQLGRKFLHEAVPPVLDFEEQHTTSKYDGDRLCKGRVVNRVEIDPDTEVRLFRYYAVRLVIEQDNANLYFCTENSKVYHGEEEQFITIELDLCPIVEKLQHSYPSYVSVDNLPHADLDRKRDLITQLWDYGIVVTKEPLEVDDDESESSE